MEVVTSCRRIGRDAFGCALDRHAASLDDPGCLIDRRPADDTLAVAFCAARDEPVSSPPAVSKAALLSIRYDLSDGKLAEALGDQASFRRSCRFFRSKATPERAVFVRFCRNPVAHGLDTSLFDGITGGRARPVSSRSSRAASPCSPSACQSAAASMPRHPGGTAGGKESVCPLQGDGVSRRGGLPRSERDAAAAILPEDVAHRPAGPPVVLTGCGTPDRGIQQPARRGRNARRRLRTAARRPPRLTPPWNVRAARHRADICSVRHNAGRVATAGDGGRQAAGLAPPAVAT
ncbi:transposase [Ensifer soli]|uniref:transposase n=1 Tax=Ciceribacter sp. sgz301302 TaxID=3342379 RepID=UPI0035B929C8